MLVKSADGKDVQATGRGQGIYNTVAGSLGIASFLGLGGNNALLGNNNASAFVTEEKYYEGEINNLKEFFGYAMDTEKRICALENRISVDEVATAKDFEISNLNDHWQNRFYDARFQTTDILEKCRIEQATCKCIKGEVYASPANLADPYKGRSMYIGTYCDGYNPYGYFPYCNGCGGF